MALSQTGWFGGFHRSKRANKMRLETKQYVMQDYDPTNFRFNKQAPGLDFPLLSLRNVV